MWIKQKTITLLFSVAKRIGNEQKKKGFAISTCLTPSRTNVPFARFMLFYPSHIYPLWLQHCCHNEWMLSEKIHPWMWMGIEKIGEMWKCGVKTFLFFHFMLCLILFHTEKFQCWMDWKKYHFVNFWALSKYFNKHIRIYLKLNWMNVGDRRTHNVNVCSSSIRFFWQSVQMPWWTKWT